MYNAHRADYEFFIKIKKEEVEETLFSIEVVNGEVIKKPHTFKAIMRTHIPMARRVGSSVAETSKHDYPRVDVVYQEHVFDWIASWRNYLIDTYNLLIEYDADKKIEDIRKSIARTEEEKIYALLNQSKNNFDWIEEPKNRQGNILGYFRPNLKYPTDRFGDCIGDFFCPIKTIEVLSNGVDTISVVLGIDEYQRKNTPIGAIVKGRLEVDYTKQRDFVEPPKKSQKQKKRKKGKKATISDLQSAWGGDRW
jgi:hypothetical protein